MNKKQLKTGLFCSLLGLMGMLYVVGSGGEYGTLAALTPVLLVLAGALFIVNAFPKTKDQQFQGKSNQDPRQ